MPKFGRCTVTLLFSCVAAAQSPSVSSVVNLASGQNSLSPGVLAAVFGSNLDLLQPGTVPISVLLSNQPGAVLTRSPQQITVQLPVEAQVGPATLLVERQGLTSQPFQVQLQNYAPGIFTNGSRLARNIPHSRSFWGHRK